MKKFEIEIKWGSFFLIVNTITSIFITLLICLADSLRYLSNALVTIFVVQLFYFTIKAVKENRNYGLSKGFRKFFVFVRVTGVYLLFLAIIQESRLSSLGSSSHPFTKEDLPVLFVEESPEEYKSITLKGFVASLRKFFKV